MNRLAFTYAPEAIQDLVDTWQLIYDRDGLQRADGVRARIEAFCRGLGDYPKIGTRHDERVFGLRSTGIPGLRTVTLLFVVTSQKVTILRIGYLGRDVWSEVARADPSSADAE
jgi:plasmid stabilization system protein ParE